MTEIARSNTRPLGVSRPDLAVEDLPTPEDVFRVRRIGPRELFAFVVEPVGFQNPAAPMTTGFRPWVRTR
jgi:hypothetical protein